MLLRRDRFERACLWLAIPLGLYWTDALLGTHTGNQFAAGVTGGGAALLVAYAAIFVRRGMKETARLRRLGLPVDR